jgi:hypothetical protein
VSLTSGRLVTSRSDSEYAPDEIYARHYSTRTCKSWWMTVKHKRDGDVRYIRADIDAKRRKIMADNIEFQADCILNLLNASIPPRESFQRDLLSDLRIYVAYLRGHIEQ